MSAHNPEVVGSSPASATRITPRNRLISGVLLCKKCDFLPSPTRFLTLCFLTFSDKFGFCVYFTELQVIHGENSLVFRLFFTNFYGCFWVQGFNRIFNKCSNNCISTNNTYHYFAYILNLLLRVAGDSCFIGTNNVSL